MPLPWQKTIIVSGEDSGGSNPTVPLGAQNKPLLGVTTSAAENLLQPQLYVHTRVTIGAPAPWDNTKILTIHPGCDDLSGKASPVASAILSPTPYDDAYGLPNPGSFGSGESAIAITSNTGGNSYLSSILRGKNVIKNPYVSGLEVAPKGALDNKPFGTYAFIRGGKPYQATGKSSKIVNHPQIGVRYDGKTVGTNNLNQLTTLSNGQPFGLPGTGGYKTGAAGAAGITDGLGTRLTPPAPPATGPTSTIAAGTNLGVGTYQQAIAHVYAGGFSDLSPVSTVTTTPGNQSISSVIPAAPANHDPRTTAYALFRQKINGMGTGAVVAMAGAAPTVTVKGGTTAVTSHDAGNLICYSWLTVDGESPKSPTTATPALTLANQYWEVTTPIGPGGGVLALNLYEQVATANLATSDLQYHLLGTYDVTASNVLQLAAADGSLMVRPVYPAMPGGTTNQGGVNPGAFYLVATGLSLAGLTYVDTVPDASLGAIAATVTEKIETALTDATVLWDGAGTIYPTGWKGGGLTYGPRSAAENTPAKWTGLAPKLAMTGGINTSGLRLDGGDDNAGLYVTSAGCPLYLPCWPAVDVANGVVNLGMDVPGAHGFVTPNSRPTPYGSMLGATADSGGLAISVPVPVSTTSVVIEDFQPQGNASRMSQSSWFHRTRHAVKYGNYVSDIYLNGRMQIFGGGLTLNRSNDLDNLVEDILVVSGGIQFNQLDPRADTLAQAYVPVFNCDLETHFFRDVYMSGSSVFYPGSITASSSGTISVGSGNPGTPGLTTGISMTNTGINTPAINVTGPGTITNAGSYLNKAMTAPATPASGYGTLYSELVAGHPVPKYKDDAGTVYNLTAGGGGGGITVTDAYITGAAQTITGNTGTDLVFNAVAGSASYWTVGNTTHILLPAAGLYAIGFTLDFYPIAVGVTGAYFSINLSGSTSIFSQTFTPFSGELQASGTVMYIAASSGYVTANINIQGTASSSTLRVANGGPSITIAQLA